MGHYKKGKKRKIGRQIFDGNKYFCGHIFWPTYFLDDRTNWPKKFLANKIVCQKIVFDIVAEYYF